jgi:hypothetical protein
MNDIALNPERSADWIDYADRHGLDPVAALDDLVRQTLAQEEDEALAEELNESARSIELDGGTPIEDVLTPLRDRHGL